ncbi:MAG: hypothetical protein IJ247_00765 [Bacilli bacterium]|nr:hypothetical protein [Bacilli bacterium]
MKTIKRNDKDEYYSVESKVDAERFVGFSKGSVRCLFCINDSKNESYMLPEDKIIIVNEEKPKQKIEFDVLKTYVSHNIEDALEYFTAEELGLISGDEKEDEIIQELKEECGKNIKKYGIVIYELERPFDFLVVGKKETVEKDFDISTTYYEMLYDCSYQELVKLLLKKYGPVKGDYFLNESCKSKNHSIMRGGEGLIVHHIDEDKAIMLANDKYAINNPFNYQKADRLVYCNLLEHFLLHIKIAAEPRNKKANANEAPGIGGAVNFICRQLNDIYSGYEFKQEFMIKSREILTGHLKDYVLALKGLLTIILNNPEYKKRIDIMSLFEGWSGVVVPLVYSSVFDE